MTDTNTTSPADASREIERMAHAATDLTPLIDGRIWATHDGRLVDISGPLDRLAPHPTRKTGTVTVQTTASFIAATNAGKGAGTRVYAYPDSRTVTAVLNDHHDGDDTPAGWQDHKVGLQLKATPALTRWSKVNGKLISHVEFAELVEDGLAEIAAPDGGQLLEIAQTLQADTAGKVVGRTNLANGSVEVGFTHDVKLKAGSTGKLPVPQQLTLVFVPWYGATAVQVTARLRIRIVEGSLAVVILLDGLEDRLRSAFDSITAEIAEGTGLVPLWCVG